MPLSINMLTDAAGKRLLSWIVDNAGANTAVAPKAENYELLNGVDPVGDLSVHVTKASGFGESFGSYDDVSAGSDTGGHAFIPLFKRHLQKFTDLLTRWPASLGRKAAVASFAVAISDEDLAKLEAMRVLLAEMDIALGDAGDGVNDYLTSASVTSRLRTLLYYLGATDVASANSASSGPVNARLRYLSSVLDTRLPATLGRKAEAASLSTALATEDKAVLDAVRTALELLDNTVSGNELQVDILTSALPAGAATEATLTAQSNKLPASLGAKAGSASLSVVGASDEGVHATATEVAVDVATESAVVLASNASALTREFINDSDATMYLARGNAAVTHRGIRLNANGGSYMMSKEMGNLYRGAIYAIHVGSGTKKLLVNEGV